ncbi:histone deacetylase [Sporothrix curviconia]|uniref:Histone deacetylase n=1 Tax=Sporothrix curviconia TaxID=1260050 RepID=A0ABP0BZ76_9PEZI
MSSVHATPRRRQSTNFGDAAATNDNERNNRHDRHDTNGNAHDDALAQSLRQLSLATGTPNKSKSPSPLSRTTSTSGTGGPRSPSVASNRRNSTTPRSPLPSSGGGFSSSVNGRESRAGTPGLLRKASMNSLHGGSAGGSGGAGSAGSPGRGLTRRTSAGNLKSPSPGTPLRSPMLGGGGHGFEPLREERQRQPRPPPPTAADIARSHFQGELARHAADTKGRDETDLTPTIVVLHDACYGHRFSRPRTSRANLATIVERPERIQACAVGVSAAYVRLGSRHVGGAYMPHPQLDPAAIPAAAVPFRIHRTARALPLQAQAVTNVHGTKWMEELRIMCDTAEAKLALNGKELQRPDMDRGPPMHHAAPARLHEGDLYLCAESLQALEGALGGVCEAVDAVFDPASPSRRAFVAIRPPGHHCSADWPSGFCWINNVHVGIMHGILTHGLTHAAIVDVDLHHGDGSQAIAWQHNARSATAPKNAAAWKKTSIGYFSLHDINSFPCESGDEDKVKNASLCIENAHGQTVWNVHLEPWKSEPAFWALYADKYAALLDKLRAFFRNQAVLRGLAGNGAIFISAGFDASEWETSSMQRHKVNVPTEFYARFTHDVVKIANDECAGRVISVLEGGYSDRALFSGVLSHVSGLAGADPVTTRDEAFQSGLGYEMGSRMGALGIHNNDDDDSKNVKKNTATPYDPAWWTSAELDRIEAALVPPPPPPEPKTERAPHPATTYSSPTASSQAKVVFTPKLRRSMSGLSASYNNSSSSPISRPPSPPPPPPPEVPWTVAMHELSKLLIPTTERTTTSCTIEDLSAEATRARRERQVLLGGIDVSHTVPASTPATPSGPTRVSMRERKQVKPFGSSAATIAAASTAIKEEGADPMLERKNRRKTVGGGVTPAASVPSTPARTTARPRQASRRLSGASTVVPKDDYDLPPPPMPPMPPMPIMSAAADTTASSTGSSTRPTSAHSSSTAARPGSSMSGVAGSSITAAPATTTTTTSSTAAPLSVRKARPAGAAGTTAKTPRKKATNTSTATTSTSTTTAAKPPYSRKASNGSTGSAATSASATAPSGDDLDKLTSGMRKIKINVVTTAQKEAREKAKREAGKRETEKKLAQQPQPPQQPQPQPPSLAVATASSSPDYEVRTPTTETMSTGPGLTLGSSRESSAEWAPAPAVTAAAATPLPKPALSTQPLPPATPLAQTIGAATTPTLRIEAAETTAGSDGHSPLLTPSTEGGSGGDPLAAHFSAPAPTVFIPYQPDGLSPTSPVAHQQAAPPASSLHWLPPNEFSTPMAPSAVPMSMPMAPTPTPSLMKRADLPVFTSTSTIPFFAQGSSSSRPSSSGLSVGSASASVSAASSRPATSSGPSLVPSSSSPPNMRPRSPTKSPRKMQQQN